MYFPGEPPLSSSSGQAPLISVLPTDSGEAITKCNHDSTDQASLKYKGTKATMLISAEQRGDGGQWYLPNPRPQRKQFNLQALIVS